MGYRLTFERSIRLDVFVHEVVDEDEQQETGRLPGKPPAAGASTGTTHLGQQRLQRGRERD